VVVGGLAVQVHGHVRMTNDLDVIPAPTYDLISMKRASGRSVDLGDLAALMEPDQPTR
jgi:hypothetical protein